MLLHGDNRFTKEEKEDKEKDDTKFVKSRTSGFSRRVLEARTKLLGICMAASYWPVSDLRLVLKPWLSVLAGVGGVLYADHDGI